MNSPAWMVTLFLATLLSWGEAEAQAGSLERRHVRWRLLDVVMVPDSAGFWFIAGPSPAATQWTSRRGLVRFGIDPVAGLQWVTTARKLVSLEHRLASNEPAHFTPPLRAQGSSEFVVLATNQHRRSPDSRFVLLVSDSAMRWRSFASAAEVEELLTALEATAVASRDESRPSVWKTVPNPELHSGARVVWQPRPKYPYQLANRGRVGRVWMSYIIGETGRADPGSFFTVLSDDSLFTRSAIKALLQGRYQPAVLNGQTIADRVFQIIVFRQR